MLTVIPEGNVLPAVIAFGLGMALFTILTGNAFAAFPVMATAIGVPLLIQAYGGDPAVVGAIGMLAGFCGTLMTPMAANFNLVPAALLELKDQNGVIKAQIGTAHPAAARQHPADLFPGLPMTHRLTPETANRFAEIALGHVTREYPHKLDHVLDGPEDVLGAARAPSDLLRQLRLAQLRPRLLAAAAHAAALSRTCRSPPRVEALLDEMLTADKVAGELAYLDRAYTGGFERPYGWAWLLALHREAQRHEAEWAGASRAAGRWPSPTGSRPICPSSPTRSAPAPISTPPSR